MRNQSILTAKVNFYVAIVFVAAFGLTMTSFGLKVIHLEDPISNSLTDAILSVEN